MKNFWVVYFLEKDIAVYAKYNLVDEIYDAWEMAIVQAETKELAEQKFRKTYINVENDLNIEPLQEMGDGVSVFFQFPKDPKFTRIV
jgi:hypothetical protein